MADPPKIPTSPPARAKALEAARLAGGTALPESELRALARELEGGDRAFVQAMAVKLARDVRREHHRKAVRRAALNAAAFLTAVAVVAFVGPDVLTVAGLVLWGLVVALHVLAVRGDAPPEEA